MALDAYDNALLALPGVQFYWPLDDPAPTGTGNALREAVGTGGGTTAYFPWSAARGVVGAPSIVAATTNTCLHKTDTGDFEIPWATLNAAQQTALAQPGPFSFCAWVNPDSINASVGNDNRIWGQFFGWNMNINGLTVVTSSPLMNSSRFIVPGTTYFLSYTYDRNGTYGAAGGYLYINGIQVAFSASSAAVGWSTQNLALGGAIGGNGLVGYMQKVAWFSTAQSAAQWQSLYIKGSTAPGETKIQVFPWSRQVVPANPYRHKIVLQNDSTTPMFLSLGDTSTPAVLNQGVYLPAGGEWTSHIWNGPIQVMHTAPIGSMTLLVTEDDHA